MLSLKSKTSNLSLLHLLRSVPAAVRRLSAGRVVAGGFFLSLSSLYFAPFVSLFADLSRCVAFWTQLHRGVSNLLRGG